ncbi:unnamed protein product [Choristocarpus tenellus]
MLHELTHMEIGPHSASFYKMLDGLADECEKLVRQGIRGSNMPFAGKGRSLGGRPTTLHHRTAALQAAEHRRKRGGLMSGGGVRLGGLGGMSTLDVLQQRAVAAAERRLADSSQCASTVDGSQCKDTELSLLPEATEGHTQGVLTGGISSASSAGIWSCNICTLINVDVATCCECCGASNERIPPVRDLKGQTIERGGGSKSRPPNTASHAAAMSLAGAANVVQTVPSLKRRGEDAVQPGLNNPTTLNPPLMTSTWLCCHCNFINITQDVRCRVCKAHQHREVNPLMREQQEVLKQPGEIFLGCEHRQSGSGDDLGNISNGVIPREVEEWICALCTLINPPGFLVCQACDTHRTFVQSTCTSSVVNGGQSSLDQIGAAGGLCRGDKVRGGKRVMEGSCVPTAKGRIGKGSVTSMGRPVERFAISKHGKRRRGEVNSLSRFVVCSKCTLCNERGCRVCVVCGAPLSAAKGVMGQEGEEIDGIDCTTDTVGNVSSLAESAVLYSEGCLLDKGVIDLS